MELVYRSPAIVASMESLILLDLQMMLLGLFMKHLLYQGGRRKTGLAFIYEKQMLFPKNGDNVHSLKKRLPGP